MSNQNIEQSSQNLNVTSVQNPAPRQPLTAALARARKYALKATASAMLLFIFATAAIIFILVVISGRITHDQAKASLIFLVIIAAMGIVGIICLIYYAIFSTLAFSELEGSLGWQFCVANILIIVFAVALTFTSMIIFDHKFVGDEVPELFASSEKILKICYIIAAAVMARVLWRASQLCRNPLFVLAAILTLCAPFAFIYIPVVLFFAVLAHFLAWIFLMKFAKRGQS